MGTPSGMAAMGMGKHSSMAMPTPSQSAWSRASATSSPSASPVYTGAGQKMSVSIAGVVAGLAAALI